MDVICSNVIGAAGSGLVSWLVHRLRAMCISILSTTSFSRPSKCRMSVFLLLQLFECFYSHVLIAWNWWLTVIKWGSAVTWNTLCQLCVVSVARWFRIADFPTLHVYGAILAVKSFIFHQGLSSFTADRGPAYFWTSAVRPCNSPVCYARDRRGIGRCVRDVR